MVHQPEPKKAVALIRNAFAAKGATVQTKEAYNLLAQLWGYRDWATYRGSNPKEVEDRPDAAAPYAVTSEQVADWPVWVICSRMGDDDDELWVLPHGATIDNRLGSRRSWPLIRDEDAVRLTVGFSDPALNRQNFQDLVVATHVACEHSSADEYGFPMYANDREVAQWLEESMGWGYLADAKGRSVVEVTSHDRGDDGRDDWWVELKVHPSVHDRLLSQFEPKNLDFDCAWPHVVFDDPYLSASSPKFDPRVQHLRKALGKVFADMDGKSLKDITDAAWWGPADQLAAEAGLRAQLRSELVTLHGPADHMTLAELRTYIQTAIDQAASQPV